MYNTFVEHPVLFVLGCLFVLYELYNFFDAKRVAADVAYARKNLFAKNPPKRILVRGKIGLVYITWCIWCIFVPPFTSIGLAMMALTLIKSVVKTTDKKPLTLMTRVDSLASMVILVGGLFFKI